VFELLEHPTAVCLSGGMGCPGMGSLRVCKNSHDLLRKKEGRNSRQLSPTLWGSSLGPAGEWIGG